LIIILTFGWIWEVVILIFFAVITEALNVSSGVNVLIQLLAVLFMFLIAFGLHYRYMDYDEKFHPDLDPRKQVHSPTPSVSNSNTNNNPATSRVENDEEKCDFEQGDVINPLTNSEIADVSTAPVQTMAHDRGDDGEDNNVKDAHEIIIETV
jgi:hypothetical protein